MGPPRIETRTRARTRGFVKTKPQSFVESRSRDRKVEEWAKIDSKGMDLTRETVTDVSYCPFFLTKSDLEKLSPAPSFICSEFISRSITPCMRIQRLEIINSVFEESRSDEEKK